MNGDPHLHTPAGKPRARRLGIPFDGTPGPWNAITDVPDLEVGYATLIEGEDVRTGVTGIHPRGRENPGTACVAGFHSMNGNGEMTGVAWIEESGTTTGPICITNTHAVGAAHQAIVRWTHRRRPDLSRGWLLPVVAETWDGYLNDINGEHVTVECAVEALDSAATGPLEEGSVGGGTGMNCYHFKGGSGTASRVVEHAGTGYAVGAFVQANFGARHEFTIAGVPLGAALAGDDPMEVYFDGPFAGGSVIVIVATDAPLLPNQCKAFARRVGLGLGRTGTTGSHFSGDLFLALSVANADGFTLGPMSVGRRDYDELRFVPWGALDPFYEAVVQATEEAVVNALVANDDMIGIEGHRSPSMPRDRVVELLCARGVIAAT
jgi:L-aminopeptidase/D-esterase-like protein